MLKKYLLTIFIIAFFSIANTFAQAPDSINYQAVIRNNNGMLYANGKTLGLQFIIRFGSASYYINRQSISIANDYGLVNTKIGRGFVQTGGILKNKLSLLPWQLGNAMLEVAIDSNNTGSFVVISNASLVSVPYAIYSSKSDTANFAKNAISKNYKAGSGIFISNDSIINTNQSIPVGISATGNSTVVGTFPNFTINTLAQTLSLTGSNLNLSNGGGSVILPSSLAYTAGTGLSLIGNQFSNTSPDQTVSLLSGALSNTNITGTYPNFTLTTPAQVLSLAGSNLNLSNGGGSVILPVATVYTAGTGLSLISNQFTNTSPDQTVFLLSGASSNTSITGTYPNFTLTTPAQVLSLTGSSLSLSNGGGSVSIPVYTSGTGLSLAGNQFTNTSPDQTVSLTSTVGSNTSITGTYPNFTLNTPPQVLGLFGNTLSLTNGGGSVNITGYTIEVVKKSNGDSLYLNASGLRILPGNFIKSEKVVLNLSSVLYNPTSITQTDTTKTFIPTLASQTTNSFFASPNGSTGTPSFRSILAADLPIIPIIKGGTGLSSVPSNFNALLTGSAGAVYVHRNIIGTTNQIDVTQSGTDIQVSLNSIIENSKWDESPQILSTKSVGKNFRIGNSNSTNLVKTYITPTSSNDGVLELDWSSITSAQPDVYGFKTKLLGTGAPTSTRYGNIMDMNLAGGTNYGYFVEVQGSTSRNVAAYFKKGSVLIEDSVVVNDTIYADGLKLNGSGAGPTAGYLLTSRDNNGNVTWTNPASISALVGATLWTNNTVNNNLYPATVNNKLRLGNNASTYPSNVFSNYLIAVDDATTSKGILYAESGRDSAVQIINRGATGLGLYTSALNANAVNFKNNSTSKYTGLINNINGGGGLFVRTAGINAGTNSTLELDQTANIGNALKINTTGAGDEVFIANNGSGKTLIINNNTNTNSSDLATINNNGIGKTLTLNSNINANTNTVFSIENITLSKAVEINNSLNTNSADMFNLTNAGIGTTFKLTTSNNASLASNFEIDNGGIGISANIRNTNSNSSAPVLYVESSGGDDEYGVYSKLMSNKRRIQAIRGEISNAKEGSSAIYGIASGLNLTDTVYGMFSQIISNNAFSSAFYGTSAFGGADVYRGITSGTSSGNAGAFINSNVSNTSVTLGATSNATTGITFSAVNNSSIAAGGASVAFIRSNSDNNAALNVDGGLVLKVIKTSANYNIKVNDHIVIVEGAAASNALLPDLLSVNVINGASYVIKNRKSAGNVNVSAPVGNALSVVGGTAIAVNGSKRFVAVKIGLAASHEWLEIP